MPNGDEPQIDVFADIAPVPQQRLPEGGERDLRLSEIAGRPEPDELPNRFNVGRLLRRCAGVREELIAWVPSERPRYTGLGGFVLFTALMAIGSSTVALGIAFDKPWYAVGPAAVFWGVVIFNLDRWIASSPLPEHGLRRLVTFLPRLLMAVVFAVVIAEPVLLLVFRTAVTEQLGKDRADELTKYRSGIEKCNPPLTDAAAGNLSARSPACQDLILPQSNAVQAARITRDAAQKAVNTSAPRLKDANTQLKEATTQETNECRGKDGSHYGDGPVCERLNKIYQDKVKVQGAVATANAQLQTALTRADTDLTAALASADADRTRQIDAMVAAYEKNQDAKGGLLERVEALNSVADKHLALLVAVWAVRLLLITVDSIPALAKITSGTTTYDRLVHEEARLGEEKHKARLLVDEDWAQNWVDESAEHAEIGRARRQHERDDVTEHLLLTAAHNRDRQAAQFPAFGDGQVPFGQATYTVAPRLKPAGPALRPPPSPKHAFSGAIPGRRGGDPIRREHRGISLPLPSISVVALGGPGSGKTTFLAQMYGVLHDPDSDLPFTLTLPDGAARTHLENWAATIREPGDEWPDSTATTRLARYEFSCGVRENGVRREILKVDYWDYSGEALLQDTTLPGIDKVRRDLSAEVVAADALLVVVDGKELCDAYAGDLAARSGLIKTLSKIKDYAAFATCPVQVVVTKWDELASSTHPDGGPWTRARIMRALDDVSLIRTIGHGRTYRAGRSYGEDGMRVIPVSVVGGAGSTRRAGDQSIRLGIAQPVNIDVPFVGLLPDRLDQIYAERGGAALERQLRLAKSRVRWTFARVVLNIAGAVAGVLPFGGFAGVFAKLGETALTSWVPSYVLDRFKPSQSTTEQDRQLLDEAEHLRRSASATDRARDEVMAAFSERLVDFDEKFPAAGHWLDHDATTVFDSPGDDDDGTRNWV